MTPHPPEFHGGRLLVATPVLEDPNFARSVVLLLDHDDEGALGVVLNRPSDVSVAAVLPEWSGLASSPGVVFGGGPVKPDAIVALARATPDAEPSGWEPIVGDLRLVDLSSDAGEVTDEVETVRVFAGYAGWDPGQLEAEMAEGAWVTVDATCEDAFTTAPDQLWRRVLRRQPGRLRLLSTFPANPRLN